MKTKSPTGKYNWISLINLNDHTISSTISKANTSLPESTMETCSVVLTCESVDEILWCDHSNETSLAVLLHGTICSSILYKMNFGISFSSGLDSVSFGSLIKGESLEVLLQQ